ncbi:hypothetical protein BDC45DRAFT_541539 [Circinella umbellata]|nr:hypothetical protein BDC45DRAFT_541539 [Circinella umbellata]
MVSFISSEVVKTLVQVDGPGKFTFHVLLLCRFFGGTTLLGLALKNSQANDQSQPTSQAPHQHPRASFAQLMNQSMYHPFGPTLLPSSEAMIMGRLDSIQGKMTSISQVISRFQGQQDVTSGGEDRAYKLLLCTSSQFWALVCKRKRIYDLKVIIANVEG